MDTEIYKISYVITDEDHPGAILDAAERPRPGDLFSVDNRYFEVIEVFEVSPARGGFHHVQANCRKYSHPSVPG